MYEVPIPADLKDGIEKIFHALTDKHAQYNIKYRFNNAARLVFNQYHDEFYLPKKQEFSEDENRRGVLSKSLGYIIRLAGIIVAIENAACIVKGKHINVFTFLHTHYHINIIYETNPCLHNISFIWLAELLTSNFSIDERPFSKLILW